MFGEILAKVLGWDYLL